MAAKKSTGRKSTAKKSSTTRSTAKRSTARKSTAKKSSSSRSASARRSPSRGSSSATAGLDKSIESFRDSLERSVTLSRDRLQEVLDDAVRRGRMQRSDAEKVVSELVSRSRKQRDALLKELERVAKRARREVGRPAGRAGRAVRDVADRPLAQADRLRRRAGVSAGFPITAYDQLTAAQVKSRLSDLTPAELRKVRDYERRNQKRKGVVSEIEKKLT
jgi:polyhydroxyalkanoate synthesis regulator phasin